MAIYEPDGSLWGTDVVGPERAERLNRAFEAICKELPNETPECVFTGAPRTLQAYRHAARWAANEWGPPWEKLVDALK